jgi:hypothetical protein
VLATSDGPWEVAIATAAAWPTFSPAPSPLSGLGNAAAADRLPRFSGTIRYRCRFDLPAAAIVTAEGRAVLDFGEAFETVEAWLDGRRLGLRICPPYQFALGAPLDSGSHELVVEVTNTLVHSHGDNGLDRAMPVDPSGLLGPVTLRG